MAMTTCRECRKQVAADAPTCPQCGVVDPGEGHEERDAAAAKASQQVNRGCAIGCGGLIFLVVVLVVAGALSGGDDASSGVAPHSACRDAVRQQLANPATANFSLLSTNASETAGGGWVITGSLEARTGFGVERSLTYRCTATAGGAILSAVVNE